MFEIMPIERRSYRMRPFDPFREMQEMQRAFWGNTDVATSFRTDISETSSTAPTSPSPLNNLVNNLNNS